MGNSYASERGGVGTLYYNSLGKFTATALLGMKTVVKLTLSHRVTHTAGMDRFSWHGYSPIISYLLLLVLHYTHLFASRKYVSSIFFVLRSTHWGGGESLPNLAFFEDKKSTKASV